MVFRILCEFAYLFVASSLLGAVFGLLTAFCLRRFHFHHTAQVSGAGAGSGAALGGWGAPRDELRAQPCARMQQEKRGQPPRMPSPSHCRTCRRHRRWR